MLLSSAAPSTSSPRGVRTMYIRGSPGASPVGWTGFRRGLQETTQGPKSSQWKSCRGPALPPLTHILCGRKAVGGSAAANGGNRRGPSFSHSLSPSLCPSLSPLGDATVTGDDAEPGRCGVAAGEEGRGGGVSYIINEQSRYTASKLGPLVVPEGGGVCVGGGHVVPFKHSICAEISPRPLIDDVAMII
ncbi:unnamed protein product [Pleuronectes platessa]|uniref:Uncharacterized protein n=1 Tax=Pleuronectes platessa TaxID=8262 RepID=A0A9N7V4E7_PLEPL|nr:unnamed protein product [Pleuronectes platessa]